MQVSLKILTELKIFRDSFLVGVALIATYDIIRLFRRIITHGKIWAAIEDFFYWILSGSVVFLLVIQENKGKNRFYIFAGILLGASLFHRIIGKRVLKFLGGWIRNCKKKLKNYRRHDIIKRTKG